ncbi:MAG: bifunctional glycosyltransferase family 2/GtrA family protein [Candidatus Omnitrophota bacterium]
MNLPVLIPAYNPTKILSELVQALIRQGFQNIVVVDDGSESECAFVFREIEQCPECTVLRHAVNLGKGAALKTGLNHIYCSFPDRAGAITLDADGQHLIGDVLRVEGALMLHPEKLIVGARKFDQGVPLRSRVGNFITKNLFCLLLGKRLMDTQSGLRGIPMDFIPQLLKIGSNSYEFELDMLLACKYAGRPIFEEVIQTVYLEGNKSSHFNPLIDSMKIYFALFRFALASLLAALIDNVIFFLAYGSSLNIATSQITGRVLSATCNYLLVKKAVFYSKKPVAKTLPEYFLLVCISGAVSYFMIKTITAYFPVPVIAAKIFSETVIFLANFTIQRDFIFTQAAQSKSDRFKSEVDTQHA